VTIIWNNEPQGSDGWLLARRGAITGSRAKDARARLKGGGPGEKMLTYAMDTAREREGGQPLAQGQNTAMRIGTEQEPIARMKYEAFTGELVEEVGFAHTHDGRFGCSLDGSVGPNGAIEVKTLVGSTSLFKALVDGDISDYRDQCLMAMWLLTLDWVDVVLWAPDLDVLRVVRVNRDEEEIAAFEADMLAFDRLVESYRAKLRTAMADLWLSDDEPTAAPSPAAAPQAAPANTSPLEPAF